MDLETAIRTVLEIPEESGEIEDLPAIQQTVVKLVKDVERGVGDAHRG